MTHRHLLPLFCLLLALTASRQADAWDELPPPTKRGAADEAKSPRLPPRDVIDTGDTPTASVRRALLEKTRVGGDEKPFTEYLDWLAKRHHFQLTIDLPALVEEGIQLDSPATLKLSDITVRSVLRLLLEPLQLTAVIQDEVLTVTTKSKADELLEARLYRVAKLVSPEQAGATLQALSECIEASVEPDSWQAVGGTGSIKLFEKGNALAIRQTQSVHDAIARLLAELERVATAAPGADLPAPAADRIRDAEQVITATLQQRCTVKFEEVPLEEVLAGLSEKHKLPIWIDHRALAEEGVQSDSPPSVNLQNVRLSSALDHILRPLQLTWLIEDEVLKITTRTAADGSLPLRVYDVRDLLLRPDELKWPPRQPAPNAVPGMMGGAIGALPAGFFFVEDLQVIQRLDQPVPVQIGGLAGAIAAKPYRLQGIEGACVAELFYLIQDTIEPDSWQIRGGTGAIRPFRGSLIVRQTHAVHTEIEALLQRLREVKPPANAGPAVAVEEDPQALRLVLYPVSDFPLEKLAEIVSEEVAPESWKSAGGKATVHVVPDGLAVRQTGEAHRAIVRLLYRLVVN